MGKKLKYILIASFIIWLRVSLVILTYKNTNTFYKIFLTHISLKQMSACKHSHRTCADIYAQGGKGVGLVVYLMHKTHGLSFGLGRERGGSYAGQYNLCAGSMDACDGGCFLETSFE